MFSHKNSIIYVLILITVLGELSHGKFPLVKLPCGKSPPSNYHVVNSLAKYSPAENSPVFVNAFFIHHSLKMKQNLSSHKMYFSMLPEKFFASLCFVNLFTS